MSSVEVKNLVKNYKEVKAVDGINFSVEEGEVFGLLGPNGAGKSTTIKILTTLLDPTSGSAKVKGFDVDKEDSEVRKNIGVVFQENTVDELLTGRNNLRVHGLMYGLKGKDLNDRIDGVLELVELDKRADDQVKKYSGGMVRRLEIARGLMHVPKVLFLDEPTIGLDPQSREHIWEYIQKMAKENKMTIFLTTHYMEEAEFLCDRIAIIDHGKVIALDSPDKLKKELSDDIIKIKTNKLNKKKIEKLKYVDSVKKINGEYLIALKDANKHLKEILGKVGDVESVEIKKPNLNDVFLHYTGHELREEA